MLKTTATLSLLALTTILLLALLATTTSCTSLPKVVRELAKDPATVHLSVRAIWGTVEVDRTAPTTSSLPHVVGDGKITVTR